MFPSRRSPAAVIQSSLSSSSDLVSGHHHVGHENQESHPSTAPTH